MGGRNFGDFNLTGQFFILTRFSKMVFVQEKELYFSERGGRLGDLTNVTPSQKFFSIQQSWSSDSTIILTLSNIFYNMCWAAVYYYHCVSVGFGKPGSDCLSIVNMFLNSNTFKSKKIVIFIHIHIQVGALRISKSVTTVSSERNQLK